jgi:ParB/RepB/Spo0J family partition protein
MATSTQANVGVQMIDVDRIAISGNVRELDTEHVGNLAGSIKLRGLRVPVIVSPDGDGYELVAGFHRFAAHKQLGLTQIRAEIQADAEAPVDRGLENIARKQLDPYQEAQAVRAMLGDGLTEDGAAQALGWPRARVTARMRLLELPEAAQQMVGRGEIALSAVEQLRAIGRVSPELLDLVIAYLADGNQFAAERLTREPGWVLDAALRETTHTVFAAYLSQVDSREVQTLRLGKRTEALYERAVELSKQLDRYSYGASVRFAEAEIDQARAAGAVIEFERGWPILVDRGLYRELCKQAIARTVSELDARVAEQAQERTNARREQAAGRGSDPLAEARREGQRQLRELGRQAHGVNLDLGAGVLNGLATVDPNSIEVARFFVYGLLGPDHDGSAYTQAGERVVRLAMAGVRLVVGDFRTDVTKTLKSGGRGTLRIDYGDAHDPSAPLKWMWKFIDGARTAGELYGRALAVIAAEQYASRLVVPQSQRSHPTGWGSHNDRAAKALAKLAKPYLPASLGQLQKAVEQAHCDSWAVARQNAGGAEADGADAGEEPSVEDVDGELEDEDLGD